MGLVDRQVGVPPLGQYQELAFVVPEFCSLIVKRGVIVRGLEKPLDGKKESGDGVCGAPLVFEDVKADVATHVDVGVKDRRFKFDSRWSHWIILRKGH